MSSSETRARVRQLVGGLFTRIHAITRGRERVSFESTFFTKLKEFAGSFFTASEFDEKCFSLFVYGDSVTGIARNSRCKRVFIDL